jgi:aromatic ring hydroxylase
MCWGNYKAEKKDMALIRPTAEHRESLKSIYKRYGNQNFLEREVKDIVSHKVFRRLCIYDFVKDEGKYKLVTPSSKSNRENVHFVNIYRLDLNDALVRDYVDYNYLESDIDA